MTSIDKFRLFLPHNCRLNDWTMLHVFPNILHLVTSIIFKNSKSFFLNFSSPNILVFHISLMYPKKKNNFVVTLMIKASKHSVSSEIDNLLPMIVFDNKAAKRSKTDQNLTIYMRYCPICFLIFLPFFSQKHSGILCFKLQIYTAHLAKNSDIALRSSPTKLANNFCSSRSW